MVALWQSGGGGGRNSWFKVELELEAKPQTSPEPNLNPNKSHAEFSNLKPLGIQSAMTIFFNANLPIIIIFFNTPKIPTKIKLPKKSRNREFPPKVLRISPSL